MTSVPLSEWSELSRFRPRDGARPSGVSEGLDSTVSLPTSFPSASGSSRVSLSSASPAAVSSTDNSSSGGSHASDSFASTLASASSLSQDPHKHPRDPRVRRPSAIALLETRTSATSLAVPGSLRALAMDVSDPDSDAVSKTRADALPKPLNEADPPAPHSESGACDPLSRASPPPAHSNSNLPTVALASEQSPFSSGRRPVGSSVVVSPTTNPPEMFVCVKHLFRPRSFGLTSPSMFDLERVSRHLAMGAVARLGAFANMTAAGETPEGDGVSLFCGPSSQKPGVVSSEPDPVTSERSGFMGKSSDTAGVVVDSHSGTLPSTDLNAQSLTGDPSAALGQRLDDDSSVDSAALSSVPPPLPSSASFNVWRSSLSRCMRNVTQCGE